MCGLLTKHPVKMVVSIGSCINASALGIYTTEIKRIFKSNHLWLLKLSYDYPFLLCALCL